MTLFVRVSALVERNDLMRIEGLDNRGNRVEGNGRVSWPKLGWATPIDKTARATTMDDLTRMTTTAPAHARAVPGAS
jgi:hypothetical protein